MRKSSKERILDMFESYGVHITIEPVDTQTFFFWGEYNSDKRLLDRIIITNDSDDKETQAFDKFVQHIVVNYISHVYVNKE